MKYIRDISATTGFAAVIGSPLSHSKSPLIYNTSFELDKLNLVYLAFETSEDETIDRIQALKSLNAIGINVTMPGKFQALQCVDELDQAAQYVQCINMLIPNNGRWIGFNTDGKGFWNAVQQQDVLLKNQTVTIFGSGNTTRIILAQAALEGIKHINIIARNIHRPLAIKNVITSLKEDFPNIIINLIDSAVSREVKIAVTNADILVQTTSVGMSPNTMQTVLEDETWLNPNTVVCDIVYEPLMTQFIQQAQRRGCKVITGIDMLVHQAALNYTLMTGYQMNIEAIQNIIKRHS